MEGGLIALYPQDNDSWDSNLGTALRDVVESRDPGFEGRKSCVGC